MISGSETSDPAQMDSHRSIGRDFSPIDRVEWLDLRAQYESIKEEVDEAIQGVLSSGRYVLSEDVFAFEEEFAHYCGVRYGVGVRSGSDAIALALIALGISEGDEVLLPDNSCLSEPNAIVQAHATPVPVDIDERTYNVDPDKLAEQIGPKTKVIHAVHAYGQPCDMLTLSRLGHKNGLLVLEDISLAPGTRIEGERVGQFGDVAVASFGHGKILNAIGNGGGIVLTNSQSIADKVRILANYGCGAIDTSSLKEAFLPANGMVWLRLGYNSALDSIQAAVLRVKLRYLDRWLEQRAERGKLYDRLLANLDVITPYVQENVTCAYRGYVIRVKERSRILAALKAHGVDAATLYLPPIHLQPAMKQFGYQEGDFPVTERVARELITLPIYPELEEKKIEYVAQVLSGALCSPQQTTT